MQQTHDFRIVFFVIRYGGGSGIWHQAICINSRVFCVRDGPRLRRTMVRGVILYEGRYDRKQEANRWRKERIADTQGERNDGQKEGDILRRRKR